MLRLVERVMGEGPLVRGGEQVTVTGYELTVYRHWETREGELTPGHYEIDGYLMAAPEALESALGVHSPLTLHLDDGRRCDLYVLNTEGLITCADQRGLY